MPLLRIENLHTYYGHVHALKGIDLEVEEGENRHPHRGQRGR
jgi:branched-chain amino acid transport system ATP-binding protein